MKATDGIASVALGLGKTVVEGGMSVRFCPKYPRHLIQFSDIDSFLNYSQKEFYAVELEVHDDTRDHSREMVLNKFGLDVAEKDGSLTPLASTYSPENDAVYDGLSRAGTRLVTFAPILKSDLFPLPQILDLMLELGSWGMSSPVEIEFAVDYGSPKGKNKEFALLQMRPLVRSREVDDVEVDGRADADLICQCPQVLGNGLIEDIRDIIMVDYDTFDRSKSHQVAREISSFNRILEQKGRPYVLIGVGRWGTQDPWLGIPVQWDEISGARVIVECDFKDLKVVPSQGSHFFHNITSFMIGYFTVNSSVDEGFVDWDWLTAQTPVARETYTRHLEFDEPIQVKMNGHLHKGVISKPGAGDNRSHSNR